MEITFEYLKKCGFKVDVEMNLSAHFFKDESFELINFEGMDFPRDSDWELIIFSSGHSKYAHCKLIAEVDNLDKVKTLLKMYGINPDDYFNAE